jgi:hypothetical protein
MSRHVGGNQATIPFYKQIPGSIKIKDDGSDDWDPRGHNQFHLIGDLPYTDAQPTSMT